MAPDFAHGNGPNSYPKVLHYLTLSYLSPPPQLCSLTPWYTNLMAGPWISEACFYFTAFVPAVICLDHPSPVSKILICIYHPLEFFGWNTFSLKHTLTASLKITTCSNSPHYPYSAFSFHSTSLLLDHKNYLTYCMSPTDWMWASYMRAGIFLHFVHCCIWST